MYKKLYLVFSLNHKKIGLVYLFMGIWSGFVGLGLSMMIRLNMMSPYHNMISPELYKFAMTSHGIVMIFFFLMPVLMGGFGNVFMPLFTRLDDMKLPRINSFSLWILMPSMVSLMISMYLGAGLGWTFYPPLSSKYFSGTGSDYLLISLHLAGLSSMLGALNFMITTHYYFYSTGLSLTRLSFDWVMRTPIFVWAYYFTAILLFFSIPVLAGAITMLLFDRKFGTSYFDPTGGGDPLMFQHMFWFFGHPEVYVLILPGFGMVGHICTELCNSVSPLGYVGMVFAMFSIVVLGFVVWAHHMFTVGMDMKSTSFFSAVTALIGMPTGVKVIAWVAMLSNVSSVSRSEPIMWWIVGFISLFTLGGMTGLILSCSSLDVVLHDSWFVVAHFHYVLSLGSYSTVMMGVIWWWPVLTGLSLNKILLQCHCMVSMIGFNLCFFPMHYFGLCGLPRRVCSYDHSYAWLSKISTLGSFISSFSAVFFVFILWLSLMNRDLVVGSWRNPGCTVNNMVWPLTFHTTFHTQVIESSFNPRMK